MIEVSTPFFKTYKKIVFFSALSLAIALKRIKL